MSRNSAVATVGLVNVLAPTGTSIYYRLTWPQPNRKPGRTSGGCTLEGAIEKAAGINAGLQRTSGPKGLTPLKTMVDEYVVAEDVNRRDEDADWSGNQRTQVTAALKRMIRGHESLPVMSLDRDLADTLRAQGGTPNVVTRNTSILRGLLDWGRRHQYLSREQAEMLPTGCARIAPALNGTKAPRRHKGHTQSGASSTYVSDEDAPSIARVVALGMQMQALRPKWGRLCVELACDAGTRWGELFQLTAYDVTFFPGGAEIRIDWQIDASARVKKGDNRRSRPKHNKTRETIAYDTTITGYKLVKALKARCAEAIAEQEAGTNDEALLFPTEQGLLHHHTDFHADVFVKAAVAAGWPVQHWTETKDVWNDTAKGYELRTTERQQFELVFHSLRHRFARTCVDVRGLTEGQLTYVGGWADSHIVSQRYYRSGKEHFEGAKAKATSTFKAEKISKKKAAKKPNPKKTKRRTATAPRRGGEAA